jgi:predicted pyridoxine 5'-phosphate oxidase superfamily flavin-nucleotide-binding protein
MLNDEEVTGRDIRRLNKRNKGRKTYWTYTGRTGDLPMVKLNAEMKEAFGKLKLFPVATASRGGVPNVVPIVHVMLMSDDTIWIADNFMQKSLANVKENPHIAIYVYDPDGKKCFQVKGTVEVKTSGPDFEKMRATVRAKKAELPAKSLLIMKVTEVFQCYYGANAGSKLL